MKSKRNRPQDGRHLHVRSDIGQDELTPFIARLEEITERYRLEVLEISRDAAEAVGLDRNYGFAGPMGYSNQYYDVPTNICLEPMLVSFRAYRQAKDISRDSATDEPYMVRRIADKLASRS